jgi:GNAT superfamily N-acetyltransferase
MDGTVIRAAHAADAAQIAVVHVRSWQGAYRGLLPQAYLDGLDPAERVGRWERSLAEVGARRAGADAGRTGDAGRSGGAEPTGDSGRTGDAGWAGVENGAARSGVLVADAGGDLLGFASYSPSRDSDTDPGRVGEIGAIYLLPSAWGKGIGRRLMDATLACLAAAGFVQVTLWVLDSNVRARRFYEAGGWSADGGQKLDASRGFPITQVRYRRSFWS